MWLGMKSRCQTLSKCTICVGLFCRWKGYPLVVMSKLLLIAWERRGADWPRLSLLSCGQTSTSTPWLWLVREGGTSGGHIFTLILTCCLGTFSWLKFLWLKPYAARFWIALTTCTSWGVGKLHDVSCVMLHLVAWVVLRYVSCFW